MSSKLQGLWDAMGETGVQATVALQASPLRMAEWEQTEEGQRLGTVALAAFDAWDTAHTASAISLRATLPTRVDAEQFVAWAERAYLVRHYSIRRTRKAETFTVAVSGYVHNDWTAGWEDELEP